MDSSASRGNAERLGKIVVAAAAAAAVTLIVFAADDVVPTLTGSFDDEDDDDDGGVDIGVLCEWKWMWQSVGEPDYDVRQ